VSCQANSVSSRRSSATGAFSDPKTSITPGIRSARLSPRLTAIRALCHRDPNPPANSGTGREIDWDLRTWAPLRSRRTLGS
jgi:hypothetical protein